METARSLHEVLFNLLAFAFCYATSGNLSIHQFGSPQLFAATDRKQQPYVWLSTPSYCTKQTFCDTTHITRAATLRRKNAPDIILKRYKGIFVSFFFSLSHIHQGKAVGEAYWSPAHSHKRGHVNITSLIIMNAVTSLHSLSLALAAAVAPFQRAADLTPRSPCGQVLRALCLTAAVASAVGPATDIPSYTIDVFFAFSICPGGEQSPTAGTLSANLGPPPSAILNASGAGAAINFVASECNLGRPLAVNFSAAAAVGAPTVYWEYVGVEVAHSLPLGTPITRTLAITNNAFMAYDGGLELSGPRTATALWRPEPGGGQGEERTASMPTLWDAAPIDITIAFNIFAVRNVVRFVGALPRGSSLRITDNRFLSVWSLSADQPFSGANMFTSGITYSPQILITQHRDDVATELIGVTIDVSWNEGALLSASSDGGFIVLAAVHAGSESAPGTSPPLVLREGSNIIIANNALRAGAWTSILMPAVACAALSVVPPAGTGHMDPYPTVPAHAVWGCR